MDLLMDMHMNLCDAISSGKVDDVRYAIEVDKADVNKTVLTLNSHILERVKPLALAVQLCQLDIIQLLLDKGADVNKRNCDGLTPLMIAATGFRFGSRHMMPNETVFRLIFEQGSISRQSRIDALELIGVIYIIINFEQGLSYWREAMALCYDVTPVLPKPTFISLSDCARKAFAGATEVKTLQEMENLNIFNDNDPLTVQALLASYRILGASSSYTWDLLSSYAKTCWELNRRQRFIDYNMLVLECSLSVSIYETTSTIRRLTLAFYCLSNEELGDRQLAFFSNVMTVLFSTYLLLKMMSTSYNELQENINLVMYCVIELTKVIVSMDLTPEQSFQFRSCLYQLVRLDISISSFFDTHDKNLLLIACSPSNFSFACFRSWEMHNFGLDDFEKLPSAEVIRVLLEVGADPNSTDSMGNTGLHLLINGGENESSPAVLALFRAGTHVDQTNNNGKTMIDLLYNDYTFSGIGDEENWILVNPLQFPSLKCLCARVVRQNSGNLPEDARHRLVPSELFDFIHLH